MMKWLNTVLEMSSSQNGEIMMRLYSPSSNLYFMALYEDEDWHQFLNPPASVSVISVSVLY